MAYLPKSNHREMHNYRHQIRENQELLIRHSAAQLMRYHR
jgi:hypothetical protein